MNLFDPEILSREFGDAVSFDATENVATPQNEESAAQLVKWCGAQKIAFVARGGGNSSHIGAAFSRPPLTVSTQKLNTIHEHDEGNATVEVGSGITLRELDETLRARGQYVPIEYSNSSSLGGAVATDLTTSVALKYGTPRDLVTGLHVALSDGRLVKAGGKVVKNVSGYDLNKLFIGSFGTLGLITRVTIRLRPQDESGAICRAQFSRCDDAKTVAWQIFDGAFEPTSLRLSSTRNERFLEARFDGVRASVSAQIARLQSLNASFETENIDSSAPLILTEQTALPVQMRARLPLRLAPQWIEIATQNGATKTVWDCGLGSVRADFDAFPDLKLLRDEAEKRDGWLRLGRAPLEMLMTQNVWGENDDDFFLMQRLKAKFDAANVSAPGRFVGGL